MTKVMGAAMRRIQAGNALTAFGIGFTVPFLYIYVAQVRNLGSMAATSAFVAFALGALVALPFTGRIIDRRGPVPVVMGAAVAASAGALSLGLSTGLVPILLSALALGAGQAVMQPALATMIVWCSTPSTRTRAFALQFFMQNLGLGIGGLIGGQIVDVAHPGSFTLLFGIEAVMFLVLAGVIATVRMPHAPSIKDAVPRDPSQAGGGWKRMLRHQAMVKLLVLGFVVFFACYGQFESGLAAFGTEAAGISPSTLGFALAANTGAIVVAQFVVLRLVEKRRRSRVIALVGLIWTGAWLIAGFSGLGHGSAVMARPRSSPRTRSSGSVRRCCRRRSRRSSRTWRRRVRWGSTTPRLRWSSRWRWRWGRWACRSARVCRCSTSGCSWWSRWGSPGWRCGSGSS